MNNVYRIIIGAIIVFLMAFLSSSSVSAYQYEIIKLDSTTSARSISDNGLIVGITSGVSSVLMYPDGSTQMLNPLSGDTDSTVNAVNNAGYSAGTSVFNPSTSTRPVVWGSDGQAYYLGNVGASSGTLNYTMDINDLNAIAGYGQDTSLNWQGFFMADKDSSKIYIGKLPDGNSSIARAVNNLNQVTGWVSKIDGQGVYQPLAYIWSQATGIQLIGVLPGGNQSVGFDINGNSQIVGKSKTASGEVHAIFWDTDSGMIDMGTLGGTESYAWRINDNGYAVGYSLNESGNWHAFLWHETLQSDMLDLNDLIDDQNWTLTHAYGINDNNQIVGQGIYNGEVTGFLLNPVAVPEPTSFVLLGLAFVVLRKKLVR